MTFIPLKLSIRQTDFENQCYIVEYDGKDYKVPLFDFQISHTQPDALNCLVEKDDDQHVTRIVQDMTSLLQSVYRVGQSYMFKVKSSRPSGADHYEVEDERKLVFKLYPRGGQTFTEGQNVRCQVREISGGCLSLDFQSLVNEADALEKLRLELEGKAATMGQDGSTLVDLLFDTERADAFDMHIDRLLVDGVAGDFTDEAHTTEALQAIDRVSSFCLYVLEDSSLLRTLRPDELHAMQQRLDTLASLADVMGEAVEETRQGRAAMLVEQTLTKLSASGYLFDAWRKLQRTDYLLTLNPELSTRTIGTLFDVITKRDNENLRTDEPFTTVFMRMLEHYIQQSREHIDSVNTIEGDEQTQNRLANVVKALAMQQLLARGHQSLPFDAVLNRSLLYRYLTFLRGIDAPRLLEKAYACLMNDGGDTLEFGWDALSSDLLVGMKVNSAQTAGDAPLQQRAFTTSVARLTLGSDIAISPARPAPKCKNVLPQPDLLPWHHMEVHLNDSIHFQQAQDKESLLPYEMMWRNIERHLFAPDGALPAYLASARKTAAAAKTSRLPEEGTMVTVRATSFNPFNGMVTCRIVDKHHDGYEGEGVFDVHQVVNYKFQPDISVFQNDEGWPLLLEAHVVEVDDDGRIRFDLRGPINQAILDDYNDPQTDDADKLLNYEDDYLCVVTNYSAQRNSYSAVADNGLTFTFPRPDGDEVLPNSTYVKLHLFNRARMGNGMHEAEFVSVVTDKHFLTQNAVNNLLQWYSYNEAWNPADDAPEADEAAQAPADGTEAMHPLSAAYVGELMMVLDRLAVVTTDYRQAYNYLGFTRLVALMLDNQRQANYYGRRMKFIRSLQYFETNGSIDESELQQQELLGEDVVKHYQGLYTQYQQLRCVSYMQQPQHNADLWDTVQQASDTELGRLAKLVLAYNLLGEFRQQQGQILVHREINALLGIKGRESQLRSFGEEDFHTEFKTSIVFPPDNNMREDAKRQTENILHVVCGFLNAEGGRLYLGVNNEGMGTGLHNDALSRTFNNGKNFHDSFDRYVTDNVRLRIGLEEAMCIRGEWVDANGRDVYCLTVRPSSKVARIEGRCWRRVNTESVELRGETLHRFMEQRAAEVRGGLVNAAVADAAAAIAADAPGEAAPAPSTPVSTPDVASPIASGAEGSELTLSREMRIRGTVYPRYEGAYARGYINIIDRFHYMHTADDYPYTGKCRISVPVYEDMTDPHMLLVYTDGTALRVPVDHIFDQPERQLFTLYKSEADIAFAAIMDADDLLLTMRRDRRGRLLSRCDSVQNVAADNSLNARGHELVNEGLGEFVTCALINEHQGEFRRLRDLPRTSLGSDLTAKSYAAMHRTLEEMGIADELGPA